MEKLNLKMNIKKVKEALYLKDTKMNYKVYLIPLIVCIRLKMTI